VNGPEADEEFEQYLRQRSVLPHRLAKTDHLEPPPELDRIVLAQAREAIQTSAPAPVYRPTRWALPFGLAATIVIAFAVLLHMREGARVTERLASAAPVRTLSKARELASPPPSAPAAEAHRSPVSPAYARARQEAKKDFGAPTANTERRAMVQRLEAAPVTPLASQAPPTRTFEPTLLSPADWRAKIVKLRAEGKFAEADREQADFIKAYPGEPPVSSRSQ
jgi:hypothetical protein